MINLREDIFSDGDMIFDIKIAKETFIQLEKKASYYNLKVNKAGLKTFIRIFNKLLMKKYSFIHLSDINIKNYYVNHPDYFFDYPSLMLDIGKLKKTHNKDQLSEYAGMNEKKGLELFLTIDTLERLHFELKKYVALEQGTWCFVFNDNLNSVLQINLDNYKSNRI